MTTGTFEADSESDEETSVKEGLSSMEPTPRSTSQNLNTKSTKDRKKEKNAQKERSLKKKEQEEIDKNLSFNLIVQKIRRKHMIAAITSKDPEKRQRGHKILKNVARLLKAKKAKRNQEQGLDMDELKDFNDELFQ